MKKLYTTKIVLEGQEIRRDGHNILSQIERLVYTTSYYIALHDSTPRNTTVQYITPHHTISYHTTQDILTMYTLFLPPLLSPPSLLLSPPLPSLPPLISTLSLTTHQGVVVLLLQIPHYH